MQHFHITLRERRQDTPIFHLSEARRAWLWRFYLGHPSVKSGAEMLEQKLVWIVLTSSPLILWKVFSCACHIFGALRSGETCGPVLPREHGFPCGFPVPSTFALCQTAVHTREQSARCVLRLLVRRQFSHLLWVMPVGLSTQSPVWG